VFNEDPFFFGGKRKRITEQLDVLVSWYRDIFILKYTKDTSLVTNADRIEDLKAAAASLSDEKAREMLHEALRMRTYVRQNVNPKLALANLACRLEG
jgi:DNA polymerase-3 subunit delta'